MLPNTSRICMYMLPFGYAARATRMVSCGTGLIPCALRDIDALLVALLLLLYLPFLASPFLYRQWHTLSPVVSKVWKIQDVLSRYVVETFLRCLDNGFLDDVYMLLK